MPIEAPQVSFRDGQLYSDAYDDVYFSSVDGLAESRYVFLENSGFIECVKQQQDIVVAETGFGTGLNFLATWQAWKEHARDESRLHYISIEKFPLSAEQIKEALVHWPELKPYLAALLSAYPIRRSGFYRLSFEDGRIQLLLYFEDIVTALQELSVCVDCWYLDGFAPKQNAAMWSSESFKEIARLSKKGAGLSTFTAAGFVRRGLEAQGFAVEKVKGFGTKRQMLRASYTIEKKTSNLEPWFQISGQHHKPQRIAIIGAGLAGCSAAFECARRGMDVHLFDSQGIAQAASGNAIGMCGPNLAADDSPFAQFYFAAWLYATQQFKEIQKTSGQDIFEQRDIHHVLYDEHERERAQRIVDQQAQLDAWAKIDSDVLGITNCAMVSPQALCEAYCDHERIGMQMQHVDSLIYENKQWHLFQKEHSLGHYDGIIIANAQAAMQFELCNSLEAQLVRGQLMYLEKSQQLDAILHGECYLTPVWNDHQVLGATFQRDDQDVHLREADQLTLIQQCRDTLNISLPEQTLQGRVSFRSCGPDRMPTLGPLIDAEIFRSDFADLKHGRSASAYNAAVYLPNCCVSLAHGSRGIVGSIWAAACIADYLSTGQWMMPNDMWKAVAPQRFLVRQLKRV